MLGRYPLGQVDPGYLKPPEEKWEGFQEMLDRLKREGAIPSIPDRSFETAMFEAQALTAQRLTRMGYSTLVASEAARLMVREAVPEKEAIARASREVGGGITEADKRAAGIVPKAIPTKAIAWVAAGILGLGILATAIAKKGKQTGGR